MPGAKLFGIGSWGAVPLDRIDTKLVQRIVEEFPREGTKTLIGALLQRQIDAKPLSRIGAAGKQADIVALLNAAPFAG